MTRDVLLVCLLGVTGVLAVTRPPAIYIQPPHEVFFKAGEAAVTLPCVAEAVPNARYPVPWRALLQCYIWSLNGFPFIPSGTDDRIVQLENVGTIVFNRPEDKDEGIYQCVADNGYGKSATITIGLREAKMNDFDTEMPGHYSPQLGAHLTLNCVPPQSVPAPEVHWVIREHNGTVTDLSLDARVTMDHESRLRFTNVRAEDYQDGKAYACMAVNSIAQKTAIGHLSLINPRGATEEMRPVTYLWASPNDHFGLRGDPFKIKCIFAGNPTSDVQWARPDGHPLANHTHVASFGQELVFERLEFSDQGDYECWGENALSPRGIHRTISIRVESRPYWTEKPKDVELGRGETAHFKCLADAVPKPDVFWYINTVPLKDVTDPRIDHRFQKVGDNEVVFVDVTKDDDMVIQCNVTNKQGYIWGDVYLNVPYAFD